MSNYKNVHIWEFPPARTFVRLNEKFRKKLFIEILKAGGNTKIAKRLNKKAVLYGLKRNHRQSNLYNWKRGFAKDRGVIKEINIPLWALIELSKILSRSNRSSKIKMRQIEKNIEAYRGQGKSLKIISPRLPLAITPELVSIVFHLCGDGHIGIRCSSSHYRQTNPIGLESFVRKIKNCFGNFELRIKEDSKVIIPRIITDFYVYYFKLNRCRWYDARIPDKIKNMKKEFLVAGLNAFIVDEGHIEDYIEIYSSNKKLLTDIKDIITKLKYKSSKIQRKYRYGKFNGYRLRIPPKSIPLFYGNITKLLRKFPTCGLAQKSGKLISIIRVRTRGWSRKKHYKTKNRIKEILQESRTVAQLSNKLDIRAATVREHLTQLEESGNVIRSGYAGRSVLWTVNH